MNRRDFLSLAAVGLVTRRAHALADGPILKADVTLNISEIALDLSPKHSIKTLAYNGQVPGPLLRMREGKQVIVDVVNDTKEPEMLHWHGFHIPAEVDGAHEEGTPMVMGHSRRRYVFTPEPTGTRWYHTHTMAGHNFRKAGYSGQFGMVIIEPSSQPGGYDQEVPILLHEWDPHVSPDMDGDLDYRLFSINGKMLGAGDPVHVRRGQRVLFRVANSSATIQHRLALPGHTFQVVALDGNAVKTPVAVPILDLGPGERVDAIVVMNSPGVWVFGEVDRTQRAAGAGVVVEYAEAQGAARWTEPPAFAWNYAAFSTGQTVPEPEVRIPLVFEPQRDGYMYSINGKSFPNTDPINVRLGSRTRLILDNKSHHAHPVHLHRHTFELVRVRGNSVSGIFKDVVVVPAKGVIEADIVSNQSGPSLFHCHHQFHMDFGFMAVMHSS